VATSTIDVGKLVIGVFDPARKQLVWRGSASKTLDFTQDPDKNYRNFEKAMAKLFKNYPPAWESAERQSNCRLRSMTARISLIPGKTRGQ
jgi:hypothetical protein